MTFSILIIAMLVACCSAILAWLFLGVASKRVEDLKKNLIEIVNHHFSTMFVFVEAQFYINLYMAVVLILPGFIWLLSGKFILGVLCFALVLIVPKIGLDLLLKKRLKTFEKQLPDALVMMAGSLRVGASLTSAVETLVREAPAPMSQEFGLYLRERKLGENFEAALTHMETRVPLEDFSMCISAIRISREVGGNLAETLEILADTLRRKLTMEGKIDSLTAQGKLQGIVMSSLPVLLIIVLMRIEPAAMGMLFTTRIGWAVLALVSAMQVLGFLAIRKITSINV
jgi:tight adherence protein B